MDASHGSLDIRQQRNEISELKKALADLYTRKEAAFQQKEQLKKEVYSTIAEWKKLRDSVIASSREKSELKKQRDTMNQKGKELLEQARELNKEKETLLKKHGKTIPPDAIKEKIKRLETKIETEAMKFDQEKKVMQAIKELKKQLQATEAVRSTFKQSASLSKTMERTLEDADTLHKELFLKNLVDKGKYNRLKELSKKIRTQKKQQEEAFNQFINAKKEFAQKNEEFRAKCKDSMLMLKNQQMAWKNRRLRKEQEEAMKIAALEKAVEEKFRTKKKLTTEDLLVFQRK